MNRFVERSSQSVPHPWQSSLKSGRSLAQRLLLVSGLVIGRVTRGWAIVLYQFGWHCWRVAEAQGTKGLALHLKACSVMTMQAIAGRSSLTGREFGPGVRRSHSGLPRVIPALHRQAMRRGSARHIRVWLTLFGLYRVIPYPGVFSVATITTPFEVGPQMMSSWRRFVPIFLAMMLQKGWRVPKRGELEASVSLLLKTSPNTSGSSRTSLSGFLSDAYTWERSPLWPILEDFCKMTGNSHWLVFIRNASVTRYNMGDGPPLEWLGKLGVKEEPGKIRVFAMVDCFTQCLLRPIHDLLFRCLALISQDGTKDQERPLRELLTKTRGRVLWSLDLSAATDRLPISLQEGLVSAFIRHGLGPIWRLLLVGRAYHYSLDNDYQRNIVRAQGVEIMGSVFYAVGQPMGAYSSWAMLALTHHAIVQWAANRIGYKGWFELYAVLGDDIVIADGAVAKEYLSIMDQIGVKVGLHKSLVGKDSAEFAKRVYLRGNWVTPVALKEFALASTFVPALVELVRRLSDTPPRLASIARALGFGYRAISRLSLPVHRLTGRIQGLLVCLYAPFTVPFGADSWVSFFRLMGPEGTLDVRWPAVLESAERMVKLMLEAIDKRTQQLCLMGENIASFYIAEPKGGTFVVALGDADPWRSLYAKDWDETALWADWWISPLVGSVVLRLKDAYEALVQYRAALSSPRKDLSDINRVYDAWVASEDTLGLVGDVEDLSQRVKPPRVRRYAGMILRLARRVGRILSRGGEGD